MNDQDVEPSEDQVDAFALEYFGMHIGYSRERIRSALRAAFEEST